MSVLLCDRNGCENILCDRYSYTYGYICNECFEELVRLGIDCNIHEFMKSSKGDTSVNDDEAIRNYFDNEFISEGSE